MELYCHRGWMLTFKNYSYYDSASLYSRKRVADFEEDLYGLKKSQFKKRFADKLNGL